MPFPLPFSSLSFGPSFLLSLHYTSLLLFPLCLLLLLHSNSAWDYLLFDSYTSAYTVAPGLLDKTVGHNISCKGDTIPTKSDHNEKQQSNKSQKNITNEGR